MTVKVWIPIMNSLHTTPTIDRQIDTGDEAGFFTAEVQTGIRNILWAARSSKWDGGDEPCSVLLVVLFAQESGAPISSQCGQQRLWRGPKLTNLYLAQRPGRWS